MYANKGTNNSDYALLVEETFLQFQTKSHLKCRSYRSQQSKYCIIKKLNGGIAGINIESGKQQ